VYKGRKKMKKKKGMIVNRIVCLALFLFAFLILMPIKASALSETVKLNYNSTNGMLSFETKDNYYYSLYLSKDGTDLVELVRYNTSEPNYYEAYAIDHMLDRFSGESGTYVFQAFGFSDNNYPDHDISQAVVQSNSVVINYEKPAKQLETPIIAEPKYIQEDNGKKYIYIEWNPVANARSYEVHFDNGSSYYHFETTDAFTTEPLGVFSDGEEYSVQVRALSNNVQKYRDSEYAVAHNMIKMDSSNNMYLGGNKVEPEIKASNYAQVRLFVNRLYKTTMGRNGETEGLDYWTNHLLAGDLTGAQAAEHFILSTEFEKRNLTYNEFLGVMYAAFFDRKAEDDPDGYYYWLDAMYNGATKKYLVACFVDSNEFTNICNSYGIVRGNLDKTKGKPTGTQGIVPMKVDSSNVNNAKLKLYVEKLYTTILGRGSESGGCEYWIQVIKEGKGMDAGKAASRFFQEKEYKDKNKTDEEFLLDVYAMFFGRNPIGTPDEEGYNFWLDNLKNERVSRVWLIEKGFGQSDEFKEILRGYGFVIVE
jgi:hypothetical protein